MGGHIFKGMPEGRDGSVGFRPYEAVDELLPAIVLPQAIPAVVLGPRPEQAFAGLFVQCAVVIVQLGLAEVLMRGHPIAFLSVGQACPGYDLSGGYSAAVRISSMG